MYTHAMNTDTAQTAELLTYHGHLGPGARPHYFVPAFEMYLS